MSSALQEPSYDQGAILALGYASVPSGLGNLCMLSSVENIRVHFPCSMVYANLRVRPAEERLGFYHYLYCGLFARSLDMVVYFIKSRVTPFHQ